MTHVALVSIVSGTRVVKGTGSSKHWVYIDIFHIPLNEIEILQFFLCEVIKK